MQAGDPFGSPEETTLRLLKIFEHINFFNLLVPGPDIERLATWDDIEALYWRLGHEIMNDAVQPYARQHSSI